MSFRCTTSSGLLHQATIEKYPGNSRRGRNVTLQSRKSTSRTKQYKKYIPAGTSVTHDMPELIGIVSMLGKLNEGILTSEDRLSTLQSVRKIRCSSCVVPGKGMPRVFLTTPEKYLVRVLQPITCCLQTCRSVRSYNK